MLLKIKQVVKVSLYSASTQYSPKTWCESYFQANKETKKQQTIVSETAKKSLKTVYL